MTRRAFENAIAVVMAVGGSTNAVLHLLAMAHAAEVPLTIDDFEAVRARTPVLCDLSPSGRYVTVDLHKAGGIPQVMKILLENGRLHGDCLTITGETVAETLADVPKEPRGGSGGDPALREAHVRAGPPRDPQGQPRPRRGRGQDDRGKAREDDGARARLRVGGGVPGRDPRREGSSRGTWW